MAFPSRTFVDYQGTIPAEWLNAVNEFCVNGGNNSFSTLYVDTIRERTLNHGVYIEGITLKGGEINFGAIKVNSNGFLGTYVVLADNIATEATRLVASTAVTGTATLSATYGGGDSILNLQASDTVKLTAPRITIAGDTTFTSLQPPVSNAVPTLPGHLTNHQYVEEHLTLITGILSGCEYSVVMGGTSFSITAGTARVVESNYPNPETHTDYTVPAFTNVTDNYPTSGLTVVGVQLVGGVASLVQQNTDFTDAQRLTIAPICIIAKSAGVIIAAASLIVPSYASGRMAMDLYRALGPVCNGLTYSGYTGQTLRRSSGTLFRVGGNYLTNKTLPNTVSLLAQQPVQFASYSRNSSNAVFSNSGILTSFDPSKYDDGGASTNGIPTGTVSANRWQAVRIWVSSNGYSILQYGTATYSTSDEAISGVTSENFYAAPITTQLPFRGLLIVRGGATDFTQASDAIVINAGKLGDSSSATAGTAPAGPTAMFDTINEYTPNAGVTIDGVLVKDNNVRAPSNVIIGTATDGYIRISKDGIAALNKASGGDQWFPYVTRDAAGNPIQQNISVPLTIYEGQTALQVKGAFSAESSAPVYRFHNLATTTNDAPGGVYLRGSDYPYSSTWDRMHLDGSRINLCTYGAVRWQIASQNLEPAVDNTYTLGSASLRPSLLFAATGTINTSDEREKVFADITTAEVNVAKELRTCIRKFKWVDAIDKKGSQARWHFGVGAQTVKTVFEKHGLDGFEYGVLCYDEWDATPATAAVMDKDGNEISAAEPGRPSGNRYGIRYDELCMFILAAL